MVDLLSREMHGLTVSRPSIQLMEGMEDFGGVVQDGLLAFHKALSLVCIQGDEIMVCL